MDILEIWHTFRHCNPTFIHNYIAYHHYRSHGWVVKSGLKFGVNFILYRQGPTYFHADYAITVINITPEFLLNPQQQLLLLESQRNVTWSSIQNLNRLAEQVAKSLIQCYVIYPNGGLTEEICGTPNICFSKVSIEEIEVKRFVVEKERH